MSIPVGINGVGRIGRAHLRLAAAGDDLEVDLEVDPPGLVGCVLAGVASSRPGEL